MSTINIKYLKKQISITFTTHSIKIAIFSNILSILIKHQEKHAKTIKKRQTIK